MLERTRLLGPELILALERADEVLSSHDSDKRHAWKSQSSIEHASRAIAHLANAILNKEDGTEIEAAHGVIRAIMALQVYFNENESSAHRLCASHAKRVDRQEAVKDALADLKSGAK